jgi:hypothetical protein
LNLSIKTGWFVWKGQGAETNDHSLYLKVLLDLWDVAEDKVEHIVQLPMALKRSNSSGLIVPEVHHDTLNQHIFVVACLGICQLTDVEMVYLMDALRDSFSKVLKHCHEESNCAHWVHFISQDYVSIMENLLDEVEHHLEGSTLALEIGGLEYIGWLYHEINQGDWGLTNEISHPLVILDIDGDNVLVNSPHSFTHLILIVDEFCNHCETLISMSVSWLWQSGVNRLL